MRQANYHARQPKYTSGGEMAAGVTFSALRLTILLQSMAPKPVAYLCLVIFRAHNFVAPPYKRAFQPFPGTAASGQPLPHFSPADLGGQLQGPEASPVERSSLRFRYPCPP